MKELPLIACSLDAGGQARRAAEWRALMSRATHVERAEASASIRFPAELDENVRALVAAEAECCPFFDFRVSRMRDEVQLQIGAPLEAIAALDALL